MKATSSNLVYKDCKVWEYSLDLYLESSYHKPFIVTKLSDKERIVSLKKIDEEIFIGIESPENYFKIITVDDKNIEYKYYREHTLINMLVVENELVLVTQIGNKTIVYFGIGSDFTRIINIENMSSPFCMNYRSNIIFVENIKNNKLKIYNLNTKTKNIISKIIDPDWFYTVGTMTNDKIFLAGFIPNFGVKLIEFDKDLNIISTRDFRSINSSAPYLFTVKNNPFLAIEPYTEDYKVELYNINNSYNCQILNSCISPDFYENTILFIDPYKNLIYTQLDIKDFEIQEFTVI